MSVRTVAHQSFCFRPVQTMASQPSNVVKIAHGIVETLAIIIGFVLTMIGLMSVVGIWTDNRWVRSGVALVVAVAVPLVITDRLLPEGDESTRGKGIFTDVLAIVWLGFGLVWMAAAIRYTHPMLRAESQRLDGEGLGFVSVGVDTIIGAAPGSTETSTPAQKTKPVAAGDAGMDAGMDAGPDAARPDATGGSVDGGHVGDSARGQADATSKPSAPGEKNPRMSPVDIFKKYSPAVVAIEIEKQRPAGLPSGPGGTVKAGGTGFIIDEDGTIATNHHVVEGGESITIRLQDGTKITKVWQLTESSHLDLALLQVETDHELDTVELGDSDAVEVGQPVVAIGNPLGLEYTMTDGMISARRMWRKRQMIQMSVPISPGNSGGPLLNLDGQVVGVNTAGLGNAFNRGQNLNLAVPINKLKTNLIDSSYPQRRKFGHKVKNGSW